MRRIAMETIPVLLLIELIASLLLMTTCRYLPTSPALPSQAVPLSAEVELVAVLQDVAEDVVHAFPGAGHNDSVRTAAVVEVVVTGTRVELVASPANRIVSLPLSVVIVL
jgi:hypothetical protein